MFSKVSIVNSQKIASSDKDKQFAQKPLIIQTSSRLEIEEQKKIDQEKQKQQDYISQLAYNYDAYQRDTYTRESSTTRYTQPEVSYSNNYSYGWCTWYAASKRNIPNSWGNAGQWLYSAQANGYATGYTPSVNSVIVTSESGWGHVGIVEEVKDGSIVISEMNFIGWGIVSSREISVNNPVIKGYIY